MSRRHDQRGMTLISWIVVIAVAAFFAVVGLKSVPIYLNHYKIVSILNSVANQPTVRDDSAMDIRKTLEKRFEIDMVSHLDDRNVKIVGNQGGGRTLVAEYEVRIHWFYNVDAVYVFNEKVPIRN